MGFPWSFIQSIRNHPTSKRIHIPERGKKPDSSFCAYRDKQFLFVTNIIRYMGHLDLISMILKAGWLFGLSPSPIVVTIDGLAALDRKTKTLIVF